MLAGAHVRGDRGETGRILFMGPQEICIGWQDGRSAPREERLSTVSERLRGAIKVWTFDEGWQPVGRFIGSSGVPMTLHGHIDQLRSLLSETVALDERGSLDEKTKHYPFKRKKKLGPGPRGGSNKQADAWNCKCAGYKCQCKGADGQKKTVIIDPDYKADYNKEYRAWVAKKGAKKKK